MEAILKNIISIREKKGISQKKVADTILITQSGYSKIESGYTKLDVDTLIKLAKLFEMDVLELIAYPDKVIRINSKTNNNNIVLQINLPDNKVEEILKIIKQK